jgi:transcription elongation factor GreB
LQGRDSRVERVKFPAMSKAFTRESEDDGEEPQAEPAPPPAKNYISPAVYARLKAELKLLVETERPEVVRTVSWAAKNGDRSENGDYLYGKKRLREIDRRVRFLIKRLEAAQVVDAAGRDSDQIFFGSTIRIKTKEGEERTITIVGVDETDSPRNRISWISPVAKALIKAREGDTVVLKTPGGVEELEILEVRYDPID